MARGIAGKGNPNFIEVQHGRLAINVPIRIFKRGTTTFREPQAGEFFGLLVSRYPWLTPDGVAEVKREAKEAMGALIELEEDELVKAERLLAEHRPTQAMRLVSSRLESDPDDIDAWQLKGRIHFALGEKEEGYRAFARAGRPDGTRRKSGGR